MLRFEQNHAEWARMHEPSQALRLQRFEQKFWRTWKCAGQPSGAKYPEAPSKVSTDNLCDRIYRTSQASMTHWTAMFRASPLFQLPPKAKKRTPALRLKLEYLHCILQTDQMLSLGLPSADSVDGQPSPDFFCVVSLRAAQVKLICPERPPTRGERQSASGQHSMLFSASSTAPRPRWGCQLGVRWGSPGHGHV